MPSFLGEGGEWCTFLLVRDEAEAPYLIRLSHVGEFVSHFFRPVAWGLDEAFKHRFGANGDGVAIVRVEWYIDDKGFRVFVVDIDRCADDEIDSAFVVVVTSEPDVVFIASEFTLRLGEVPVCKVVDV